MAKEPYYMTCERCMVWRPPECLVYVKRALFTWQKSPITRHAKDAWYGGPQSASCTCMYVCKHMFVSHKSASCMCMYVYKHVFASHNNAEAPPVSSTYPRVCMSIGLFSHVNRSLLTLAHTSGTPMYIYTCTYICMYIIHVDAVIGLF